MSQNIEDVVALVLAKLLRRSVDEVLADTATYGAFHWDDGFLEAWEHRVKWKAGKFKPVTKVEYPFWARADFDPERSIVCDDCFDVRHLQDPSLKAFVLRHNGHLFLPQVGEVLKSGHVGDIDYPTFYGRIQGGTTLIEAGKSLFRLHTKPLKLECEYYEVDPAWVATLEQIVSKPLRHHLGAFFQTAQVARSFGAWFGGEHDGTWDDLPGMTPVACWQIGEGQGAFCLATVDDAPAESLPALGPKPKKPRRIKPDPAVAEAANTFVSQEERLERIDALLDKFDKLNEDDRRRTIYFLGNPWSDAPAQALPVLTRAISIAAEHFPDFVKMLHFQKGFAADLAGDQELSIDCYTQAIACDPEQGMYYYNRACEFAFLGRADEAFADLETAISLDPGWRARAARSKYVARLSEDPRYASLSG